MTKSEIACNNFLKDLTKISRLHKVVLELSRDKLTNTVYIKMTPLSNKHDHQHGKYEFFEDVGQIIWSN